MSQLNLALTCIAFVVIAVGLLSRRIHRWPVSKPMLALIVGFLVGPEVLALINPHEWVSSQYVLEETARITLAIGLMAVGLRVPRPWLAKNWSSPLILITVVMLAMWAASAAIIYLVIAAPLWLAVLMGAVVTPTDPILAGTIVTGDLAKDSIPARIRHSLSVESGANDGLAFAAVTLGITMVNAGAGGPISSAWR